MTKRVLKFDALETALIATNQAATEALTSAGVNPDYISYETGTLPDSTGAEEGDIGAYFTSDGLLQRLEWDGSEWQEVGEPIPTKSYVDEKAFMSIVNVMEYGAVGDGIVDDTDAIHAAIEDRKGRWVFLPKPENYYLVSGLKIPSNCVLMGSGFDCEIRLQDNTNANVIENEDSGIGEGNHNITIDGLYINGNFDNQDASWRRAGLEFRNVQNVVINRVRAESFAGHAIAIERIGNSNETGNKRISISNCIARFTGDDGITTHDCDGVTIVNCHASHGNIYEPGFSAGIEIDDNSRNVSVTGCSVTDESGGYQAGIVVKAHEPHAPAQNVAITGCNVHGPMSAGIVFGASNGDTFGDVVKIGTVVGNTVRGASRGYIIRNTQGVNVTGNTYDGEGSNWGYEFIGSGSLWSDGQSEPEKCIISNNIAKNCAQGFRFIDDSENNRVFKNLTIMGNKAFASWKGFYFQTERKVERHIGFNFNTAQGHSDRDYLNGIHEIIQDPTSQTFGNTLVDQNGSVTQRGSVGNHFTKDAVMYAGAYSGFDIPVKNELEQYGIETWAWEHPTALQGWRGQNSATETWTDEDFLFGHDCGLFEVKGTESDFSFVRSSLQTIVASQGDLIDFVAHLKLKSGSGKIRMRVREMDGTSTINTHEVNIDLSEEWEVHRLSVIVEESNTDTITVQFWQRDSTDCEFFVDGVLVLRNSELGHGTFLNFVPSETESGDIIFTNRLKTLYGEVIDHNGVVNGSKYKVDGDEPVSDGTYSDISSITIKGGIITNIVEN